VVRDKRASEFGGRPGLIQPPPHDPADVPSETLMQIYATDPAPKLPEEQPRVKVDPPGIREPDPEDWVPVTERRR
jgi:hypothetical protein